MGKLGPRFGKGKGEREGGRGQSRKKNLRVEIPTEEGKNFKRGLEMSEEF